MECIELQPGPNVDESSQNWIDRKFHVERDSSALGVIFGGGGKLDAVELPDIMSAA